jgi:hypothetical protein
MRQRCPFYPLLFNKHSVWIPTQSNMAVEINKRVRGEEVKSSLVTYDTILYLKDHKDSTKEVLDR